MGGNPLVKPRAPASDAGRVYGIVTEAARKQAEKSKETSGKLEMFTAATFPSRHPEALNIFRGSRFIGDFLKHRRRTHAVIKTCII